VKELAMDQEVIDIEQSRLGEIAELAADLFSATVEQVVAATSFVDQLEVDSLLAIELLVQLEKRYGIRIPEADGNRMTDLAGTYAVVAEIAGW
jgi:acyl carrier protein